MVFVIPLIALSSFGVEGNDQLTDLSFHESKVGVTDSTDKLLSSFVKVIWFVVIDKNEMKSEIFSISEVSISDVLLLSKVTGVPLPKVL